MCRAIAILSLQYLRKQPATLPISTIRIKTIDTFHTVSSKSSEADKSLEDYDKFIGSYEEDLSNFEGFSIPVTE